MLALVASGRGGGEGKPVFFTVPWSPMIAERGEVPGDLWASLMRLMAALQRQDWRSRSEFLRLSDSGLVAHLILNRGYGPIEAIGVILARRLLCDLGLLIPGYAA